jgi:hypothetical protein
MKEVPTLVEADLETLQTLPVSLGSLPSRLLREQLVLLVGKLIDLRDDLLVVHDLTSRCPRLFAGSRRVSLSDTPTRWSSETAG